MSEAGRVTLLVAVAIVMPSIAVSQERSSHPNDCGVNCLYVALSALNPGLTVSLDQIRSDLSPGQEGNSIEELISCATRHGAQALPVRTTLDALQIRRRPFAFIAHLPRGHFILVTDVADRMVFVADPPDLNSVPVETFLHEWNGDGIVLSLEIPESEESVRKRLWWKSFWSGLLRYGILVVACGAVLESVRRMPWWRRRLVGRGA